MAESDAAVPSRPSLRSLPLAQREMALLIALCIAAVVAFLVTRSLANWSRGRRAVVAAQAFARGEALVRTGDRDAAVAALREAVAANRQNPYYALALAHALADAGRNEEARQLLLQLRQNQPDDVEINYRLARLRAADADDAEAVRYFNYAMYGVSRMGTDLDRREIRSELIGFLLDRGLRREAVTELSALGRELPAEASAHLQAARLADRAGDTRMALAEFRQVGVLEPTSVDAARGAGAAAFALQDYASARRELERGAALGALRPAEGVQLDVSRLVLASDPLAAKLQAAERERRARAGVARALNRLDACAPRTVAEQAAPDATRRNLDHLRRRPSSVFHDPDVLTQAVESIGATESDVRARCPSLIEAVDHAWIAIAELHRGGGM